jgi:aspartate 1-decarboxylase
MQITLLQAKLHRVTVTGADLNYEGSCGIDKTLLDAAGIRPFQYIELYNVSNGERFSTYAIEAKPDTGDITLNGAAARKAQVGDPLIICTYALFDPTEAREHRPTIILVDSGNRIQQKL